MRSLVKLKKILRITIREVEAPSSAMDKESQKKLLSSLTCCPHGVIAWSKEMDDLVETSTNLASVKFCRRTTI